VADSDIARPLTKATRLEKFYRERTGDKDLKQFGYDLFYTPPQRDDEKEIINKPAGAVQESYILQAGDEINIIFTGERRDRQTVNVTSDGRLFIDSLNPINVLGRTMAQVKNDIAVMKSNMQYRGEIDISLSSVRQVGVLIAGHVHKPGRQNLNAFQSVLDALNMAGGVREGGSLRSIKLIRQGSSRIIDFYDHLVFSNGMKDIQLRDGDRIMVPPVGRTFAVVGDVKQVGIFELSNRDINLPTALRMAGGHLGAGDTQYSLMRGDGQVMNLSPQSKALINDGAILNVKRATDRLSNAVEVKGYSRQNGFYDLGSAGTLHQLMGDRKIFGDDNKNIKKKQFSNLINEFILDHVVTIQGAVRTEGQWPVGKQTDLKTLVSVAGGLTSRASRSNIEITSRNAELGNTHNRRKINAKDMRLADVMLSAGDQVRVNERYEQAVEKTVRITGEVKNAGSYDLMRGDTLSSVLERAGGLTPDAYPPAAVFSRKSERKREQQKFRSAAQELERTVSVNLNATDKNASLTPSQISMARKLADDLRAVQAVGRVTVEADPAVLSVRPELDMLVEDGDHLHIPKRVLNVRVSGEVMNPASLLFEGDKDPSDYIREANHLISWIVSKTSRKF